MTKTQAYAISMSGAYQPALAIEIFFHGGTPTPLPSQRSHVWHRRGWYWRDTESGEWAGPFKTAAEADDDYFLV